MIQQLIISAGVMEDRKLSTTGGGLLLSDSTSPFLATSTNNSMVGVSSPSTSLSPATEPPQQNLRCPRCDSSNTKFCYYNNYNLTQPRHFCKTCRRYWTKGGALRNVPIGGGYRKAKPGPIISSAVTFKPVDGGISKPAPITTLWAAPPHTSQLLALLRASGRGGTQNHNMNPLQYCFNPIKSREEAIAGMGIPGLSLDPLGQFSTAAGMGSMWRNEGQLPYLQNTLLMQAEHNLPSGYTAAEVQELYHTMRLPAAEVQLSMNNGWSAPACSSLATAPASVGNGGGDASTALEPSLGGEFGYWNPALAWSDMSTTN